MELTIENKAQILSTLQRLQGATEKKSTIPILSTFHLHANGALTIRGTDLDIHLRTECDGEVKIQKAGALCVEAKKLTDIVKSLPDKQEIQIKAKANDRLELVCGRSRFTMAYQEHENFPEMKAAAFDGQYTTLPGGLLGLLLGHVRFAITTEESRYTLGGVKFEFSGKNVRIVATDGHRLAFAETKVETDYKGKRWDVLIPKRALPELARMSDIGDVGLALVEGGLYAKVGIHLLESRLLTGQFPNYEQVFPKDGDLKHRAIVDANELLAAVRRVSLMADEKTHAIKMALEKGQVRLEAPASDAGDAGEAVTAEYDGEKIGTAFNAKYLAEYLDVCPTKQTTIEMKDAQSQVLLRPVFEDGQKSEIDYKYVLMPMRL